MSFDDQMSTAIEMLFEAFEQEVSYTAYGESAETVDAVCYIKGADYEDEDERDQVTTKAELTVKKSDIETITPEQDTFVFDGDSYRVQRILSGAGATWRVEGVRIEGQRVNQGRIFR